MLKTLNHIATSTRLKKGCLLFIIYNCETSTKLKPDPIRGYIF
jgi:hypothetical protein